MEIWTLSRQQRPKWKTKKLEENFLFYFYISAAEGCVFLDPAFAAVFRDGTAVVYTSPGVGHHDGGFP